MLRQSIGVRFVRCPGSVRGEAGPPDHKYRLAEPVSGDGIEDTRHPHHQSIPDRDLALGRIALPQRHPIGQRGEKPHAIHQPADLRSAIRRHQRMELLKTVTPMMSDRCVERTEQELMRRCEDHETPTLGKQPRGSLDLTPVVRNVLQHVHIQDRVEPGRRGNRLDRPGEDRAVHEWRMIGYPFTDRYGQSWVRLEREPIRYAWVNKIADVAANTGADIQDTPADIRREGRGHVGFPVPGLGEEFQFRALVEICHSAGTPYDGTGWLIARSDTL